VVCCKLSVSSYQTESDVRLPSPSAYDLYLVMKQLKLFKFGIFVKVVFYLFVYMLPCHVSINSKDLTFLF
jgi:hypothetical protein